MSVRLKSFGCSVPPLAMQAKLFMIRSGLEPLDT